MGQSIQSGLRKFCGRHLLKNLLSPLLNTLSHITMVVIVRQKETMTKF